MYLILLLILSLFISGHQSRVAYYPHHHGEGRLTKATLKESVSIPTDKLESNEMQNDNGLNEVDLERETSFEDDSMEETENEDDVNEDSTDEEFFVKKELKDTNESGIEKNELEESQAEGSLEDDSMNSSGESSSSNEESIVEQEKTEPTSSKDKHKKKNTKEQTNASESSLENDSEGSSETSLNVDVIGDMSSYSNEILNVDIEEDMEKVSSDIDDPSLSPKEATAVSIQPLLGTKITNLSTTHPRNTSSNSTPQNNLSSTTNILYVDNFFNGDSSSVVSDHKLKKEEGELSSSKNQCSENGARRVASGEPFNIFEICTHHVWLRSHCPGRTIFYAQIACCVHPFAFPCFDNCVVESS